MIVRVLQNIRAIVTESATMNFADTGGDETATSISMHGIRMDLNLR